VKSKDFDVLLGSVKNLRHEPHLETRPTFEDGLHVTRYVVAKDGKLYNRKGQWETEPPPGYRIKAHIQRTRWTREEAIRILDNLSKEGETNG
jgi:hypothetical protein